MRSLRETVRCLWQVIANDRLGCKILHTRRFANPPIEAPSSCKMQPGRSNDTVGDLQKLISTQTGTDVSRIQLKVVRITSASSTFLQLLKSNLWGEFGNVLSWMEETVGKSWGLSVSMALPNNASSYLHDRQCVYSPRNSWPVTGSSVDNNISFQQYQFTYFVATCSMNDYNLHMSKVPPFVLTTSAHTSMSAFPNISKSAIYTAMSRQRRQVPQQTKRTKKKETDENKSSVPRSKLGRSRVSTNGHHGNKWARIFYAL